MISPLTILQRAEYLFGSNLSLAKRLLYAKSYAIEVFLPFFFFKFLFFVKQDPLRSLLKIFMTSLAYNVFSFLFIPYFVIDVCVHSHCFAYSDLVALISLEPSYHIFVLSF